MKTVWLAIVTAVASLAGPAHGADEEDRTSMPDYCSDRDVNCVIIDSTTGPVLRAVAPPSGATPVPQPAQPAAAPAGAAAPGAVPPRAVGATSGSASGATPGARGR